MPATISPIPSGIRFFGLGKEVTRGTAVAPTAFIPMRTFSSPNEMPHYADDTGLRGSAVAIYDKVATQTWANPGFDGDVFSDSFGYLLQMLMGEVATTGSTPTTATTANGASTAGASTLTVASAAGIIAGDNIQIDTGTLSEVKTVLSVASNTFTFVSGQTLLFSHATGVAVVKVVAPFTHNFSVLNDTSVGFQPPSYTITDFRGTSVASVQQMQQLPGALVSDLDIKGTATGLLQYSVKFLTFRASLTPKTSPTPSGEVVKPAWQGVTTLGGTPTIKLEDFDLKMTRKVDAIPTVNGTQDPASIFGAGDFAANGSGRFVYDGDDTEYNKMVANTSSSLVIDFSSGSGGTLRTVKFTADKLKYSNIVPDSSKSYISLPITFDAVANTTDIGHSGGYGPIKWTLVNQIPSY